MHIHHVSVAFLIVGDEMLYSSSDSLALDTVDIGSGNLS